MRLTTLQRQLIWPAELPLSQLRVWIHQQLAQEGELLRWAITGVEVHKGSLGFERWLAVEAVISA